MGRARSMKLTLFPDEAFRPFRYRNFRLLWIGLLFSFTGGFMQNAALLWHVSLLAAPGQKGVSLGSIGLARLIPVVGLSVVSGIAADAWDRRKLMLATQTLAAAVALVLAVITWTGGATLPSLYVLAALG